MDIRQIPDSSFLDRLFEHRNKAYGSYVLRRTYPQRMRQAGLFLLLVCLLSAAYTVLAERSNDTSALLPEPATATHEFKNIPAPEPPKPMPVPEQPAAAAVVKTVVFVLPEITRDVMVSTNQLPATQDDLKDAVAAKISIDGDASAIAAPDIIDPHGNGTGNIKIIDRPAKTNKPGKIPVFVEQMPEFPGGDAALNRYLSDNLIYPQAASNAGQQGNVRIKFVVNEDGSISDITVLRGFGYGSEQEAIRVIGAMPRWKPGRNNGIAVKVWFQLPIRFQLND